MEELSVKMAKFMREMKYLHNYKERLTAKYQAKEAKKAAKRAAKANATKTMADNATETVGNETTNFDDDGGATDSAPPVDEPLDFEQTAGTVDAESEAEQEDSHGDDAHDSVDDEDPVGAEKQHDAEDL